MWVDVVVVVDVVVDVDGTLVVLVAVNNISLGYFLCFLDMYGDSLGLGKHGFCTF